MKATLAAAEAWPMGGKVGALLHPELRALVLQAGGLDWLPVARNLALTQAIYDGLGPAEADRFFRVQTLASFDGPILQTMVISGVRILGLDPASFARWVPKGWYMIFRGVGEWQVEPHRPGATSSLLTLSRLPGECADHPVWGRSVARSLEALLDLARVKGAVDLLPVAAGAGQLQLRMSWTPTGSPPAP